MYAGIQILQPARPQISIKDAPLPSPRLGGIGVQGRGIGVLSVRFIQLGTACLIESFRVQLSQRSSIYPEAVRILLR